MIIAAEAGKWGKVAGIGTCVITLSAGGVWAGKYWLDQRADRELRATLMDGNPDQVRDTLLSLDDGALRAAAVQLKDRSWSDLREMMRSDDLTDEERQRLRRAMHEARRAGMDERVEEYFTAPKEKREAVLDRHIDEMLARRDQWRARREQRERDPDADRERHRRQPRTRDRQQAKERMEAGDPDRDKRMMHYRSQIRARMQNRGISMRGGPHGRGGGPQGSTGGRAGRSQRGGGGRGR